MLSDIKNYLIPLLFFLFCICLYKNISYPLIWNDESESTMMATRVIKYGYPKVNDGKNKIFAPDIPGSQIGYNKKYDACTYITWGNYFFATIGTKLASFVEDMYIKTALIRIPYATIGLIGLVIFMFSFYHFFPNKNLYKWFLILFLFTELYSITLILHMRDARSYSLVIFICALFVYAYTSRLILHKLNYSKYAAMMFLIFTLAFHTNFITFVILTLVFGVHQLFILLLHLGKLINWKERLLASKLYLINALPVIASGLIAIPFIIFFDLLKTSKAVSEYHHYTFDVYLSNLDTIYRYLSQLEFLYTALAIKIIFIGILYYTRNEVIRKKKVITSQLPSISWFLLIFIIVQVFMVARIPYYIFTRYVIVVQILLTLMMIIDSFVIIEYMSKFLKKESVTRSLYLFTIGVIFIFVLNSGNKMPYIKGHIYEMTHQYKGPLDYVIPYIKNNFSNTDSIIIATNYEEYSYMYYLKSKVIVGFCNNNIEEDVKQTPDIIMYRKTWGTDPKVFNDFIQRNRYQKVSFPVADYPVNNIPELDFVIKHLFKTKLATNENEKTEILVRTELLSKANIK